MKQRVLFWGLVLLTLIFVAYWVLTGSIRSLIVTVMSGFLAYLAKAGSEPGAPHAEELNGLGSVHHQSVYIRAMNRLLDRIAASRAMWKEDPAGNGGEWHRKYQHAKWTYALLYHRYEQAKNKYRWKY